MVLMYLLCFQTKEEQALGHLSPLHSPAIVLEGQEWVDISCTGLAGTQCALACIAMGA